MKRSDKQGCSLNILQRKNYSKVANFPPVMTGKSKVVIKKHTYLKLQQKRHTQIKITVYLYLIKILRFNVMRHKDQIQPSGM
jgi:hypothetical protein